MSTAITKSAPIARANRTGTRLVTPPSIRWPFPYGTATVMPGTAADAWMAFPAEPLASRTAFSLCRSVATAPNRMGNFSIGTLAVTVSIQFARLLPRMMPPALSVKSTRDDNLTLRTTDSICADVMPLA